MIMRLIAAGLFVTMGFTFAHADDENAVAKGKAAFEPCAACHSLEPGVNGAGPSLHGLFGRESATEDFVYSPAMRRAKVTWTPEILDGYIENPQAGRFRGNRMPFPGIPDAQTRADLVAYLLRATR